MKMSIAVPTWESYGKGNEFLDDLFRTLEIQTFQDFEVVVSDHSKDDKLVDVIERRRRDPKDQSQHTAD